MLAVLVGQTSAEVILPRIPEDYMQDNREQQFTKGEIEWNQRLFCNKNHDPDLAYHKPSYGWDWSNSSSDYHQLGSKDISPIQQDGP